jgi:hypothetical protein
VVTLIIVLVFAAGLSILYVMRKRAAVAAARHRHLARLLLVSGNAFDDRNHELYAATMREIVNIMRNERWERSDIEWRILRALASAKAVTSPDLFEKASRLAQNIIQVSAKSPTVAR